MNDYDKLVRRLRAMAKHDEKMVGYATLGGELYAKAADAITALQARVAELTNERDNWYALAAASNQDAKSAEAELAAARALLIRSMTPMNPYEWAVWHHDVAVLAGKDAP